MGDWLMGLIKSMATYTGFAGFVVVNYMLLGFTSVYFVGGALDPNCNSNTECIRKHKKKCLVIFFLWPGLFFKRTDEYLTRL